MFARNYSAKVFLSFVEFIVSLPESLYNKIHYRNKVWKCNYLKPTCIHWLLLLLYAHQAPAFTKRPS